MTGLQQRSQGQLTVFLNFLSGRSQFQQNSSEFCSKRSVLDSVQVFGYPESGSGIICTDPDPFIKKQKKSIKTLILTVLCRVADPYSFDRDPDPAFYAGSRVLMTKNVKKFTAEKKQKNLAQKLQFTYPYASIKDVQVTKEAFSSQKRTSRTSKYEIS